HHAHDRGHVGSVLDRHAPRRAPRRRRPRAGHAHGGGAARARRASHPRRDLAPRRLRRRARLLRAARLSGVRRAPRLLSTERRSPHHAQTPLTRYTESVTRLVLPLVALAALGCKHTPAAPPPPEIGEVRVVYKGAELPGAPKLDVAALTAAARSAIASS